MKDLPADTTICSSPRELIADLEATMRVIRRVKEEEERDIYPTIMIWGAPGIGKTSMVRQSTFRIYGKDAIYVDWRLSTCEPSDLLGIPKLENGATHFCPPAKFPREGKGVLHFSEINLAPLAVQHACYQLLLDGKLGDYTLPRTFMIVCDGNEKEHRAGVYEMPAPLLNRMLHFKLLEPSREYGNLAEWKEDWTTWAIQYGIDSRIITFIQRRPDRLFQFDPRKVERAYASPRSWEFLSHLIKGEENLEVIERRACSAIGRKIATDLVAYLKIGKEFNIRDMFRHPSRYDFRTLEIDTQFFLSSALVNYVSDAYRRAKSKKEQDQVLETFCVLVDKFPEELQLLTYRMTAGDKIVCARLMDPDSPLSKYSDRLFELLHADIG